MIYKKQNVQNTKKVTNKKDILSIEQQYVSFKAKMSNRRSRAEKFADYLTKTFGSINFLIFHLIWFGLWILINLGFTPIKPFDPYPFGFLTLVVSLEAIFFSIVILISENREQKINDIREELTLALLKVIEKKVDMLLNKKRVKGNIKITDIDDTRLEQLEVAIEQEVESS